MPAQHDFLPVTTHEKPTDHAAGTKSIGSRDRTLCQDCPGAVLIICSGAILSFGGMDSTLLLVPGYSGAALLHQLNPLSAIIFIVALISLRQACGAESSLLLSGGALAICAAWSFFPVRRPPCPCCCPCPGPYMCRVCVWFWLCISWACRRCSWTCRAASAATRGPMTPSRRAACA